MPLAGVGKRTSEESTFSGNNGIEGQCAEGVRTARRGSIAQEKMQAMRKIRTVEEREKTGHGQSRTGGFQAGTVLL